jgi:cellulose synthase/poly-beta-1,6-N-acetylglucosamine synthase-like glycosyltransferase
MSLPLVSILIPARNEAKHLPVLFSSLEALNYPKDKMEILLGNDQSTDATAQMMEAFASDKPHVKVHHVSTEPSQLLGKTRVLQELGELSRGNYLLYTDADMELPPNWIQGLLKYFSPGIGVVVGVTGFKKTEIWSALQGTEWLMALSLFHLAYKLKLPSTGMGNNMAVSREAYLNVGGYASIGFSIVEDYHLYKNIIDKGYGFVQGFDSDLVGYTVPPPRYFEQRKRWIKGAIENAPAAMMGGILQAMCIPLLILIAFISLKVAVGVILGLLGIYTALILYFQTKLRLSGYLKYLPMFALYISVAWLFQFLYYLFSKQTRWKNRTY